METEESNPECRAEYEGEEIDKADAQSDMNMGVYTGECQTCPMCSCPGME